jgi:hypothetical protein
VVGASGRFGLAGFLQKFVATNAGRHTFGLLTQVVRLSFQAICQVERLLVTARHHTTSQSTGFVPNMPVPRDLFNIIGRKGVKAYVFAVDSQRAKKPK